MQADFFIWNILSWNRDGYRSMYSVKNERKSSHRFLEYFMNKIHSSHTKL